MRRQRRDGEREETGSDGEVINNQSGENSRAEEIAKDNRGKHRKVQTKRGVR